MKSLNAKRIAAIAASLAVGLAFAGPVSFSNIPIINSAGQPVVQIVVGSQAKPSDGVVAANIAAVIGNLAYTSTPITATVNGQSNVKCVVTTPSCTLTNQQVYLGERGIVTAAGSYSFKALIGSVLNAGVLNFNNVANTKSPQSGLTSDQYVYNESSSPYPVTSPYPLAISAYAGVGPLSAPTSITYSNNGGGLSFSRFTLNGWDNIVEFTNAQVPGLASSSGPHAESESLWLMGFPVYNQQTGSIELMDANGAYELTFGKPISLNTSSGAPTYATFTMLGQNYTIYKVINNPVSAHSVSSGNYLVGGGLQLAQAITPLTLVNVSQSISAGPFTVTLQDLSYPNSAGVSAAYLLVYKNGVLTNRTSVYPPNIIEVNASGTPLYIGVNQTFPGLYAYQKWAKIRLFANVFNVTTGKVFNSANDWYVALHFSTNQSTATNNILESTLQGIVLYSNLSKTFNLSAGQSFSYITNPAVWKATFVGDTLGAPGSGNSNYDYLTMTTGTGTYTYTNPNNNGVIGTNTVNAFTWNGNAFISFTGLNSLNASTITEPVNLFTVTSSVPTAFQITTTSGYAQPTSSVSSVQYILDGYKFVPGNAVQSNTLTTQPNSGLSVVLTNNGLGIAGNYVSNTNPLTVTITGYKHGASTTSTASVTFNSIPGTQPLSGTLFDNVTNIQLGYDLPYPGVTVQVYDSANALNAAAANVLLGTLSYAGPLLAYKVPQYSFYVAPSASSSNVLYTVESYNLPFAISQASPPSNTGRQTYFTYTIPEIVLPAGTAAGANVMIGITNSSTILSSPAYWLNYTGGNNNALAYMSSQGNTVKAPTGFRTERGSEVGPITTTSVAYDMAKSVDTLQFLVGPANVTTTTTTHVYGPYGIGQATNIPNVTIANVTAQCSFATTSCNVTGLGGLTATPSVSQAITPVQLNTASTPLAVLDTNANPAATLIVIGSKYVNSVASQIFAQNPSLDSSFGPGSVIVQAFGTNRILVAGYSANDTVQAGNEFIQDLLTAAGSS